MQSISIRTTVVAGTFAVAACVLLLASFLPSSVTAPAALAAEATISPLEMMAQAARDLPIEHYDAHYRQ